MQTNRQLILLALILIPLVSYNFMSAGWTSPSSSNKASSNTAAPIDVSSTAQVKLGGLATGALSVTGNTSISGTITVSGATARLNQVRATQYCDENGANCRDASVTTLTVPGTQIFIGGFCYERTKIFIKLREQGANEWLSISTASGWGSQVAFTGLMDCATPTDNSGA